MPTETPNLLAATRSRFIPRLLAAQPALAAAVAAHAQTGWSDAAMRARAETLLAKAQTNLSSEDHEKALHQALRRLRGEVLLTVIERDLRGDADLGEVVETMTVLAEVAIQFALATLDPLLQRTWGTPTGAETGAPQTLGVVGMGKLGGGELNVSSDIDLIFVYDEDGETTGGVRAAVSNQEYFTKLGRKLIAALAEITADGFVFRVDMRLRPNGDSGPLVCSLGMLEEYLLVQGREWERYAWLKGRYVSATDTPAGALLQQHLEALVRPFVFRRYLDYGVIEAIRDLHGQIRDEAERRHAREPARAAADVKLGRGGIREIEFLAQTFQLIRGGQDGALRSRSTLDILAKLPARRLLDAASCDALAAAYVFLRNLEHRIQYLDDAQTHLLPADDDGRTRVAAMAGCADFDALLAALAPHRAAVAAQFDALFAARDHAAVDADALAPLWSAALDDPEQRAALAALLPGVDDADALLAQLHQAWLSPKFAALGGGAQPARARFDRLMRQALRLALHQKRPAQTIVRLIAFFEAISRRAAYLALLAEFPQALARLVQTLDAARWAAEFLTKRPQLLDELLASPEVFPDDGLALWRQQLQHTLAAKLGAADGNIEQQLDLLRQTHHAETFRILLLDLQQALTVEQVSDRLSLLADVLIEQALALAWSQLATRHRDVPQFGVIAYGRLGGKELGYGSDLDLVFVFDDEADVDERAPQIYATLVRRLISALTAHTAAGPLFEIDTRLRPNGAAGLLVTSITAFVRYQLRSGDNAAWVWEHQALTRARFCCGTPALRAAFDAVRADVLQQPHDAAGLAAEIVAMRTKIADAHPEPLGRFDLKHSRGGLVDIEFIVQYLVLRDSSAHPQLTDNVGNIALLGRAADCGLIAPTLAQTVANAYRDFRARQHRLRLDGLKAEVAPDLVAPARDAVRTLWQQLFGV